MCYLVKVVCWRAKRGNAAHKSLTARLNKCSENYNVSVSAYMMSHDVVRSDHAMGIRVGDECLLLANSWDVEYKIFTVSNFASSLRNTSSGWSLNVYKV